MSKDKNSVLLAHELQDLEEILIASCFVLAQRVNGGGMSLWSEVDYLIVKDFSKKYDLDSIEVYGVLKEMLAEFERIRGE
ncbi:hypothetical protein BKH46_09200 [Helicobacter sp. 12S02634-8]|uniref:hypothetical protein n=1 Tax=Helicobacter sp. 12S02634-8 TaxID=1476199 RepID=UPI000BA516C8|nr:hypothetical protein [Helicobacter sp. 12S02634-8]PAF45543.1 hypothetical protein BKH46_09270 [Helicobacter sp. 12S02634-8]PAF45827.1 hypothetical protein BKH46_09200 [Helicobacter sp. 12S02634-8]